MIVTLQKRWNSETDMHTGRTPYEHEGDYLQARGRGLEHILPSQPSERPCGHLDFRLDLQICEPINLLFRPLSLCYFVTEALGKLTQPQILKASWIRHKFWFHGYSAKYSRKPEDLTKWVIYPRNSLLLFLIPYQSVWFFQYAFNKYVNIYYTPTSSSFMLTTLWGINVYRLHTGNQKG